MEYDSPGKTGTVVFLFFARNSPSGRSRFSDMKIKEPGKKKPKKETLRISRQTADLIPYSSITKEGDLIETKPGCFVQIFHITHADQTADIPPLEDVLAGYRKILNSMEPGSRLQTTAVKRDGHISRYLTLQAQAGTIEEAREKLDSFQELFHGNGGFTLEHLDIAGQLSIIHRVFHFHSSSSLTDKLDGSGFSVKELKRHRLTTKDLTGPSILKIERDHIETDGGFIRIMFINSFADHIPAALIRQLSNEEKDILVSVHFESMDPEPVYRKIITEIAAYRSSLIRKKPSGSVQSGNNREAKRDPLYYPNIEEIQIRENYTALLRDAADRKENAFRISFLVALFAPTLDDLNDRTADIMNSDSRFYCKLTSLDYLQKTAVGSILPLAEDSLSVSRTFSSGSAALFLPLPDTQKMPVKELNPLVSAIRPYSYKVRRESSKKRKSSTSKKTIQETIPYYAVYSEGGIIETQPGVFSRMYRFQDINYHTATEEDQTNFLIKYSQLLNRFDSSILCQIILNNRNVDMKEFREDNLLKMKADDLDVYREEYNAIILAKMEEGRNNLRKERYMVISVEEENFEAAKRSLFRLDPEIISSFKEIGGSKAEPLTAVERLEVLYDIYNIGNEGAFLAERSDESGSVIRSTDLNALHKMGITSKDLIAPSGLFFHRDWFRMGRKYCRVLYMMDLPNTLSDKFVSELSSTNCNMVVSMNLETVRQDKAVKLVKHQMLNINSNMQQAQQTASKNGYSMELVPQDLKQAQEEADDLLRNLTGRNQKMFFMTFTVLIFADDMDELQSNTEIVVSTGRKFLCSLKKLQYQQEAGLNATLPFCHNTLSTKRTLTTDSTIIFSPFDTQELVQKNGMYYGQNATSHNLIIFNRNSSQNGNGWILGTPGSGKSFSAKREMANVFLNTDDDILIIDPEREYSPLVKAFGGSIVRIAPGSRYHLNPLDMDRDYADDDDPIVLKSDFMLSLCESVIGGRYGLTPTQIAIIDRCVNLIYSDFVGRWNYDKDHTPTLLDFEHVLEAQPEREARELALAFEIYTKGSLDVFAHESNVDIDNRFVVYDIKDIGSNIKTMAYLIVLDAVWNRVVKNRKIGRKTWIYIDEVYILFEKDESTNFIRQIFSRCRKWGGKITAITQNVEPILQNTIATTMLSNSAFIQLLNQAPVDRDILATLLHISPTQVGFINNAPPGQGVLYIQGQGIIPFRDHFSKQIAPTLYAVMTSKPDEMMEEFR